MKKMLIISVIVMALICAGCNSSEATVDVNSLEQAVSSEIDVSSMPTSSEASSQVSSEISSVQTSSETVASVLVSSESPKAESKGKVSSKAPISSQSPKKAESKPVSSKPTSSTPPIEIDSDSPNFGELMDEAVVDAIIAEGIEYANSKGMTWYEDFSVEGSGYYNPAFSGEGAEIFKRDLFYNIDQVCSITVDDPDYYDGCLIYYKIVKGEFHEKGYWYGFVLY